MIWVYHPIFPTKILHIIETPFPTRILKNLTVDDWVVDVTTLRRWTHNFGKRCLHCAHLKTNFFRNYPRTIPLSKRPINNWQRPVFVELYYPRNWYIHTYIIIQQLMIELIPEAVIKIFLTMVRSLFFYVCKWFSFFCLNIGHDDSVFTELNSVMEVLCSNKVGKDLQ